MLYDGVKVYPSYEPLKNDDSTVSVAVYHSSTHQALVDMIERLLHLLTELMNIKKNYGTKIKMMTM